MTDDPDLQPVLPQDAVTSESEEVRHLALVFAGLIGAGLVAGAIYWSVAKGRNDILPSVLLELGAGTILFVLLFGLERAAVRKVVKLETEKLYRAISTSPTDDEQVAKDAAIEDTLSLGIPPFETAYDWLQAAVDGDYESVWTLSDENWQLCRVQAWVWNNRHPHFLDLDDVACESLVEELRIGPGESEHWRWFAHTEIEQFKVAYQGVVPHQWGVGSRRRVVAPGYEIVNLVPLGQYTEGIVVAKPLWIRNGIRLLWRWDGTGWLLASNTADAPPTPGFPPSWWATDTVDESDLHLALPPDADPIDAISD